MLLLLTGVELPFVVEFTLVGVVRTTFLVADEFAELFMLFLSLFTAVLPVMLELLESALLSEGVSSLREEDEVPMPLRLVFFLPANLSAPVCCLGPLQVST